MQSGQVGWGWEGGPGTGQGLAFAQLTPEGPGTCALWVQ